MCGRFFSHPNDGVLWMLEERVGSRIPDNLTHTRTRTCMVDRNTRENLTPECGPPHTLQQVLQARNTHAVFTTANDRASGFSHLVSSRELLFRCDHIAVVKMFCHPAIHLCLLVAVATTFLDALEGDESSWLFQAFYSTWACVHVLT